MAVTVENTSASGDWKNGSTWDWNHTCPTGTELLVVLTAANDGTEATRDVTGVTYNSTALTKADDNNDTTWNTLSNVEVWYLVDPDTGSSYAVEVTQGAKCGTGAGYAVSLSGVEKTNPVLDTELNGAATGGTSTCDVTVSGWVSGSVVTAVLFHQTASSPTLTTGTLVQSDDYGFFGSSGAYNSSGDTVEWDQSPATSQWQCLGVAWRERGPFPLPDRWRRARHRNVLLRL